MPLPSTLTDVANHALAALGENLIQNIDDDNTVTRKIRHVLYESIRQTQLEIFWQELLEVYEPNQLPDTYPESDSFFQYNLPTNLLDIVRLKSRSEWFLKRNKLVTNDPTPVVTYRRYSEEPSEWSGYLFEMVYKRIAKNVAMFLVQNPQTKQQAIQEYEQCKMDNTCRASNRSRRDRERVKGYGNLRSRRISSNRYPFISGL